MILFKTKKCLEDAKDNRSSCCKVWMPLEVALICLLLLGRSCSPSEFSHLREARFLSFPSESVTSYAFLNSIQTAFATVFLFPSFPSVAPPSTVSLCYISILVFFVFGFLEDRKGCVLICVYYSMWDSMVSICGVRRIKFCCNVISYFIALNFN